MFCTFENYILIFPGPPWSKLVQVKKFVIWTNTLNNLERYIWLFGQIYFALFRATLIKIGSSGEGRQVVHHHTSQVNLNLHHQFPYERIFITIALFHGIILILLICPLALCNITRFWQTWFVLTAWQYFISPSYLAEIVYFRQIS